MILVLLCLLQAAAPCVPSIVDGEVPQGAIDGVNRIFTLANAPSPVGSLHLYRNGIRLMVTRDYYLKGATVTTCAQKICTPAPGDLIQADYRYCVPASIRVFTNAAAPQQLYGYLPSEPDLPAEPDPRADVRTSDLRFIPQPRR